MLLPAAPVSIDMNETTKGEHDYGLMKIHGYFFVCFSREFSRSCLIVNSHFHSRNFEKNGKEGGWKLGKDISLVPAQVLSMKSQRRPCPVALAATVAAI